MTVKIENRPPSEQERKALRERNLAAFRRLYPTTASMIESHRPLANLVFNEDGTPDLEFMGQSFYDGNIQGFTENQLKTYWKSPHRLALPRVQASSLDTYGQFTMQRFLDRSRDELGVEFRVQRQTEPAFFLLVQGIGLAPHLDELLERTQCRNLILMDSSLEGLYQSLDIYDWEKLLMTMQERNGDAFFFISDDVPALIDGLRNRIRGSSVTTVDGAYIYQHFNSSMFDEFTKVFNKEASLLLAGLGFFYDEQLMLRNAKTNLADGTSRFYFRPDTPVTRSCPAFVVGCGPSLDASIEHLRRNADKGIVISCGSALGPLMAAGIKPDFQIEMENLQVATVLEFVANEYDISDICLVAASTVDIEAATMFKERVFYHRVALCPYPVFSDDVRNFIHNLDPTVVNAGLGFVQEMGFQEIYLFGVDMGQRGTDKHHAAVSYHYTEGAIIAQSPFNIEVPANFGGKAKTTQGLFWALDSIQRLVKSGPRRIKYYNCSNGALLNDVPPKLPRTVNLDELTEDKAAIVNEIIEGFPRFTKADFDDAWRFDRLIGAVNDICDKVREITDGWVDYMDTEPPIRLNSLFYHPPADDRYAKFSSLMMRGSFNMSLIVGDFYTNRVSGKELTQKTHEIFKEEFIGLIEICRERAIEHITALNKGEFIPLERLETP
tara:strand:+ start:8916 stop:10910 length:1995 start_codon:yes stop_codon:yes gene_type:complete